MQGHPPDATSSGEPDPAAVEQAAKLVASLGKGLESADEVFATFEQLDGLPTEVVRDALVALTGESPSLDRLDNATRVALGMPQKPMVLRPIAIVRDADVLDLGRLAEAQLRIAGETWDGVDRSAEDRLDGESEGSFAGSLERVVLAPVAENATAPNVKQPMFDVFLFEKDAGAIFKSGTTDRVGAIAYGVVELSDRRTREGVQAALAWSLENRPASTPFYLPGAEPKPEPVAPPAKVLAADVLVDEPKTLAIAADEEEETVSSQAPTRRVATKTAAKKRRFVQASFPWAGDPDADPASAKNAGAKKKAATKKASAAEKKTATKTAAAAKKAAPKKAAEKAVAPKKATAKKAAPGKKAAAPAKKTAAAAKKAAPAKKTAAAAAKKAAPAKKAAAPAKKTAAAKKAAPGKKAAAPAKAAKKAAPAKKAAIKTAAAKKAAPAKKAATKTAAAKKAAPAAKKAAPAKKKAGAKKR